MKLTQSTQLLAQLDRRYRVSHPDDAVYPPELCQPVKELRAIIASLLADVNSKHRALDNLHRAAAEYNIVTEAAESLLSMVDARKEQFGSASEQLRDQQV